MRSILILGVLFTLTFVNGFAQEVSSPENKTQKQAHFSLWIEGIPDTVGEVRIAVFNSAKDYSDQENPLHAVVLDANDHKLVWEHELSFGEYAIAVYHDKNENGELDTNVLGIPKEAYGFSNNARGRFGPAKWENAVFEINEEHQTAKIYIK